MLWTFFATFIYFQNWMPFSGVSFIALLFASFLKSQVMRHRELTKWERMTIHVLRWAIGTGSQMVEQIVVRGLMTLLCSYVYTWKQCNKIWFGISVQFLAMIYWVPTAFFVKKFECFRQHFTNRKGNRYCVGMSNRVFYCIKTQRGAW